MRTGLCFLACTGCFQSIAPDLSSDAGDIGPREPFTTSRLPDGTYLTAVDSTSTEDWTHGDFDTGMLLPPPGAWDLRFQRFHISTNGGVTGGGGVEVAPMPGVTFGEVNAPPADGWISDDVDYAFDQGDGWYDYDQQTHVLTPKPLVWAVRTTDGATLKLEIQRYYDDAGTAGWFSLHWSPL